MPVNDNPHALRLYDSLCRHAGRETADAAAAAYPLSKSADHHKKFAWATGICAALAETLDDEIVKTVRMDCACGPETGKMERLRKMYEACADGDAFADKVTAAGLGFAVEYENGGFVLVYPCCYCSCVKRTAAPVSKSWCYCTLGYTRRMFSYILGRDVDVALLTSVKTGGESCRIGVTPLP